MDMAGEGSGVKISLVVLALTFFLPGFAAHGITSLLDTGAMTYADHRQVFVSFFCWFSLAGMIVLAGVDER